MGADALQILTQALALSEGERRALVEELASTLHDAPAELSTAWIGEIEGRIAELERGDVRAIPWSEVEERIAQTLAGA